MKPRSGHVFRRFAALVALILSTTSCFRVGLPESFADLSGAAPAGSAQTLLLAVNQDGSDAREILGAQYLLGIIPFTALYLEHGGDSALAESWFELFSRTGQVYLTRPEYARAAAGLLKPGHALSAELRGLSVNGFDALFFRILSIGGELEVRDLDGAPLITVPVEERSYAAFAHIDTLSYLTQTALAAAGLRALEQAQKIAAPRRAQGVTSLVLIQPVELRIADDPSLAESYLGSYGSHDKGTFSSGRIARLMQRGLARGSVQAQTPVVEAAHRTTICPQGLLVLDSRLEALTLEGQSLSTVLALTLKSCTAGRTNDLLAALTCTGAIRTAPAKEGWMAQAVEQLGSAAAAALLSFPVGTSNGTLRCVRKER